MKRSSSLAMPILALATGAAIAIGCGGGGKSGNGAGSGGSCKPTAAECYVAGPDGPGNECLAKADNTGSSRIQLRVSQLDISSPTTLAAPFMQDAVITKKIDLTQENCFQTGEGRFNILFDYDTTTKTLTTGGGGPQALIGPPDSGTCFANFQQPISGIKVAPVTAPYTVSGDTYTASFDKTVVIPIFIDNTSYALLPLHKLVVKATISKDHNCVGSFRSDQLDVQNVCAPAQGEFAWNNGGSYDAYITVEEADKVPIDALGESLCVLLSGDPVTWKGSDAQHTCKGSDEYKNTGKFPVGGWCSTTNSATGCTDAWHIESQFAASAIKIDQGVYNNCKP